VKAIEAQQIEGQTKEKQQALLTEEIKQDLPANPPQIDEQKQSDAEAKKASFRSKQADVLYAFTARNDQELSINPGDVINVHNTSGEWWYGELNGKFGLFPGNYITIKKQNILVKRASNSKILELQAKCGFYDTKQNESNEDITTIDNPGDKVTIISPRESTITDNPVDKVTIISPRESTITDNPVDKVTVISPSESRDDIAETTPDKEELESPKLTSKERLIASIAKHKEKQESKKDESITEPSETVAPTTPKSPTSPKTTKGHVRQNSKDKLKAMIAKKKEERATRSSIDTSAETEAVPLNVQEDLEPPQEGVTKGHRRKTSLDRLKASIAKRKEIKGTKTVGDSNLISLDQLEDFIGTQIEKTKETATEAKAETTPKLPLKSALKAVTSNIVVNPELLANQADIALNPIPVRNLESNTELGALDLAYFTQKKSN